MPEVMAADRLARRLWNAVSRADVAAIEHLTSDDITWHASGRGPRSGSYRGREAVLDYLASLGEDADRFDSELEDVMTGEHFTALLYRVTGARGDRKLDTRYVLLLRVIEGRLAEAWSTPRDQYAVDAFWSG